MYKIEKSEIPTVAKQAFITRQEPLLSKICADYGRDPANLCIKVFYGNPLNEGETLDDALWGDNHNPKDPNQVRRNTKLLVGSKIQNIIWWHGLSARVYAVFEAEYEGKRVACQLTEYLTGPYADKVEDVYALHEHELKALCKKYHFSDVKDILGIKDVLGGKVIDLQQYAFDSDFEQCVKNIYFEKGRYGKIYYQPVPELGLQGGPRKGQERIEMMHLEEIDFTGKVVWDIGSAGGFFCRYALSRGAKIVYGFDEEDPCYSAFMMSNYLGAFNIDYVATDLRNGVPNSYPKPDIVFMLSMNYHIPIPERIQEAETVIFEDNGKESREKEILEKPWTDWFNDIRYIGRALDHGNKPIYHLKKKI